MATWLRCLKSQPILLGLYFGELIFPPKANTIKTGCQYLKWLIAKAAKQSLASLYIENRITLIRYKTNYSSKKETFLTNQTSGS
jgi:hypothetical protein